MELQKEIVTKYLFGELVGDERDLFEEKIFADDEFSLFLEQTENDLVDQYVCGKMDNVLVKSFETKYLTTDGRRKKVKFARVLQTRISNEANSKLAAIEPQPSFLASIKTFFTAPKLAYGGGFALILAAFVIGYFALRNNNSSVEIVKTLNTNQTVSTPTQTVSPTSTPTSTPISTPIQTPTVESNPKVNSNKKVIEKPVIATPIATPTPKIETKPTQSQPFIATLLPTLRSDEVKTFEIPANVKTVQMNIGNDVKKDFSGYQIEIRNNSGQIIFARRYSAKSSRSFPATISKSILKSGTYEVSLIGINKDKSTQAINFYNFAVK